MNKRLLSMFLALCMVLTMLPVSAMAEEIHTTIGGSGEIISFAPLTETKKAVSLGTSIEDLELPETLTATVRTAVPADENPTQDSGSPETATPTTAAEPEWKETTGDIPVEWASPDYDMDTEGKYVFTPEIAGYTVSAPLPELTVTVGEPAFSVRGIGLLSIEDTDVAAIESTGYATLQEAVDAVTEGQTIKLLEDITLSTVVTISHNNNFTLDLNGKTISVPYTVLTAIQHAGGGTLTIQDSGGGKIAHISSNGTASTIKITNDGSVTLLSGTIESSMAAIDNKGAGDVTVSGGTVKSNGPGMTINSTGSGDVMISGGTVESTNSAGIAIARGYGSSGKIILSGTAAITAVYRGIWLYGSVSSEPVLEITGGTLTHTGATGYVIDVFTTNTILVQGGTLQSTQKSVIGNISGANLATVKINIPAGGSAIFKGGEKVLADGYALTLENAGVSVASENFDGTNPVSAYNAANIATYKYLKFEPGANSAGAGVFPVGAIISRTHNSIQVSSPNFTSGNPGNQVIEYAISTDNTAVPASGWQTATTFSGLSPDTTYYIWARSQAKEGYNAGTAVASAATKTKTQNAAPSASIDFINETLTGLVFNGSYTVNSSNATAEADGTIAIQNGWFGKNVSIIQKGTGGTTTDSPAQVLSISARPAAPTAADYAVQDASASSVSDGALKATVPGCEYAAQIGTVVWTAMTQDVGISLAPGSYKIRKAPTATSFASESAAVTIGVIASQPPVVSSVTVPTNGTYLPGTYLDFTVSFDENVTVTTVGGTPYISLTVGSSSKNAAYVSGSGTTALVFRYTVQAGDSDSDGITVGQLNLNSGTIKDTAGNNATLTLNNIGSTSGVLVNPPAPSITGQPSPQMVDEGQTATFSVTATGEGLTYKWQVDTGSGFSYIPNGGVYSGATTATLTITGITAGMNGYQYRAVVAGTYLPAVTSNSVLLTVNAAPTYTITADPTSKDFGSLAVGYGVPAVQTVTITNTGNSSVTLSQPTSTNYTIGALSTTTLAANGTVTFTVAPKAGLAVGAHNETLTVSTDHSTNATVELSFEVTAAPTYTITANPVTKDFGSLAIGYIAPAAQTVTITNTGNSSVMLTQPTSTNYAIGALSTTTLAANGTATFTITPKTGLAVGNYNETLTVSTNHSTNATVELSFAVTTVPTYTITADPISKDFGSLTVGYSALAAQTVTITNTGNSSVTLTQPTSTNYTIGTLSTTTLAANGTAAFTITPKTNLAVGDYSETLTVSTDRSTDATVELSFSVTAVPNYTVTFNPNGGTVSETSRSIASGTAVGALPAPTRSGSYSFDGWYTAAIGGTQISAGTTVNANVIYYAHWTYTGGGGSGSGGGSSSNDNSSPVIVTPPAPDKPNSPTQGEIKVPGTVDGKGNVTVSITDKTVTDAFNKALAEAKKNGTEQNGITVVLRVDTGNKTGSNVTVNLPKAVQDTIIAKKIVNTIVVVDNPDIRVGMDLATVQEINKQAKSDVNITATRTDSGKLTTEAKKAIGSRPVFDLKVNYGNGKAVSSFGSGSVSVTIPYTLGANEKAGNVQAVYVDSKGKVHWLVNSVYDSVEKVLRFSTDHFSTYGIGYKQTGTAFMDIAGHWAKEDIEFVASRGLFSGTSETKFSPDTAMTRGMFVTALGRLANADVSGYAKSSFSDVKDDAYYMGYIEWASKNNIVNGVGNGKFAPDQSITREQMAVIMSNYAKTIGYTLPKVHIENIFADNSKISTYAKEAVKQMQMVGVISGKNGNLYDPQGTATRAEVSAVLRRFMELAISSDTAQGWSMNNSGKWMYFKDGKPLTGKQDIDGATYTFDQYGVTADVPKNLRYTTYTVQKGDSFRNISRKLGCPMSELERLNNKSRFSLILPGEVLRVPEK